VSENNDFSRAINTIHLGCIDYVLKAPLVQNFVDQINCSIFQKFEKLHRPKVKKTKNIPVNFIKKQAIPKSNWEYFLSIDLVQWVPPLSSTKIALPYDEFIAKIHQDDFAVVKTQNNICLFSLEPVEYNFRFISDDNLVTTFHIRLEAEVDSEEMVQRLYGQIQELPSQPFTDQNQHLKLSFLDNTRDAVFITNTQKQIVSINDAFTTLSGYSEQEILKKRTDVFYTEKFNNVRFNKIAGELKNKSFWQGEVLIRHRKGHTIPAWQSSYVLKDTFGNISQSISVLKDITQQKSYEETIKTQANYDPLTLLPNRTLFVDRLTNAIKQTKRNNGKLALMLLDLNKFKWINDNLGHHAGDILLQETAKVLQAAVRSADTVARLGGDEFSIIVPDLGKPINAELVVRKIFNAFKRAILIDQ
ncbi:MAG: diguanylate cyclase, partial [Methylococcales bacterium]|nr:diguanylate cyclase [Methylococcales bacterium]